MSTSIRIWLILILVDLSVTHAADDTLLSDLVRCHKRGYLTHEQVHLIRCTPEISTTGDHKSSYNRPKLATMSEPRKH